MGLPSGSGPNQAHSRESMSQLRVLFVFLLLAGCSEGPWNNPYSSHGTAEKIAYSSFSERPKHLDPVRSYSANEYVFIAQIYEPLFQYHFLKRPYQLTPLTAAELPEVKLFDASGRQLEGTPDVADVAYTEYHLKIRPGIRYQPHPAFAQQDSELKDKPEYQYHNLSEQALDDIHTLADFATTGSRELTVDDYIYQIKRLADKDLHSPIAGVMTEHIDGFAEFAKQLQASKKTHGESFFDLRQLDMSGLKKVDDHEFSIRIKGVYPQFRYWLAMPFFSPMPWEADRFYSQPGLKDKNIVLDWYPIGTGPFMLAENNPNLRMVLQRNPNFHGELYPTEGELGDREAGLLDDAGKTMPFIDKAVYSLEKESIPYWNKFLQGYYDTSGVSSDSFDQAVQFDVQGDADLTAAMKDKGIRLEKAVETSIFYMGFNMLDATVGGDSERTRLLRQAISIAVDYEEFISIFRNGRGMAAQGPIPPGIFGADGSSQPYNPYVYNKLDGKLQRKPIAEARQLMEQAGYPDGKDPQTGKPLLLNFETTATGPDGRALLSWIRKQFSKLGIQLVIRATDYNRFQEKIRKGTAQIFWFGWNADYPDPENFLFLLYGKNAKVEHGGQNDVNYVNPEFDALFDKMKNMENGPERQRIIDQMVEILRHDAPWSWGFFPRAFALFHSWYGNVKPNLMANNTLKYRKVDTELRRQKREQWNQPIVWPLWLLGIVLLLSILPAIRIYKQHEKQVAQ
ncbi:MAG: ABC transporter substrate-binding protein [Chromatiales bacterium]|jgi:ABC-type transport system substrate-binding protein